MKTHLALKCCLALITGFCASSVSKSQVLYQGLGEVFDENFNALPNSGSSFTWIDNGTILGWYAANTVSTTTFNPATISSSPSTTGDLYSFGPLGGSDRSIGSIGSSTIGGIYIGTRIVNQTGATINSFVLGFTGEQWRNSAAAAQSMGFSYGIGATELRAGTFTDVAAASFTSPITGGAVAPLDGNLPANRTVIGPVTITGLNWKPGEEMWLRWYDPDHTGNDHALAIDDFAFTASSLDNDNDGMPNAWEISHGMDMWTSSDAAGDNDGDGFTNEEEYWMGSNPALASSPTVIHVDKNSTATLEAGTFGSPFKTIQAAINAASTTAIQAIRVEPGAYSEKPYMTGKANIHLFSTKGPVLTIIDGNFANSSVVRLYDFTKSTLSGFTVRNASTSWTGAGVRIESAGAVRLTNNLIYNNHTTNTDTSGGGGGISLDVGDGSLVSNNIIYGNSARRGGAVLFKAGNTSFYNNTVVDNNADSVGQGGGLSAIQGVVPEVRNNILWGNTGASGFENLHQIAASYCIVEDGAPGQGNLALDPQFVDASKKIYEIQSFSPAIGAGYQVPVVADIGQDIRVGLATDIRDIGADEYVEGSSIYNRDYDGDGLSDWFEEHTLGSNPLDTDGDGDGMTDGWEHQYGTNILVNDADLDLDGDGLTNLEEYFGGSNPADPGSPGAAGGRNHRVAVGYDRTLAVRSDGTVWQFGRLADGSESRVPVQITGLANVVSVATGSSHSAALKSDGTVWTWGDNQSGQLGDGSGMYQNDPVRVSGLTDVVSLAAGSYHTMVVRANGSVWGWGSNSDGQLGDGTTLARAAPVQAAGLTQVNQVAAGGSHTVALKADGTVWAWGQNYFGQLGDGTTISKTLATQVASLSDITALTAGTLHSAAIREDGTVWAWGFNYAGQIGIGYTGAQTMPSQVVALTNVVSISAGGEHNLAVKSDGTVWGWGENDQGQLNDGSKTNRSAPVQSAGLSDAVSTAAGAIHQVVLTADGSLWAWGDNYFGQLGDGSTKQRDHHAQLSGISAVTLAKMGPTHGLISKTDGSVWAWGNNAKGQLGDGTDVERTTPVQVVGLINVKSLGLGDSHSLAIKQDGTVVAWGGNESGQLGTGSWGDSRFPVPVSGLTSMIAVAGGFHHSVGLKSDGTVWTWGDNEFGQLGNGGGPNLPTPVQVAISDVSAIAAGPNYSIALKTDGTLWTWGSNYFGQLGDGSVEDRTWPVRVSGLNDVVSVAAGDYHVICRRSDGSVWAWGYNQYGQLGDGNNTDSYLPLQIPGAGNAIAVAAGQYHSIIVNSDADTLAWGANGYGQLGDGTTVDRWNPTQIPGVEIGAGGKLFTGGSTSIVLKADGTLFSWGNGASGQLANAFADSRLEPQPVVGLNLEYPAPEITVASPANNTLVALGSEVTLEVAASVSTGTITGVYFYADGIQIGEDLEAPFALTYYPSSWGDMEINIVATASTGAISAPIYITLKTLYDSDFDTLPDWLENYYTFSLSPGIDDDYDFDGIANGLEIANGTNPFSALADTDNDGLYDDWELYYYGNLTTSDGTQSLDGDWMTDIEEMQAHLDPTFNDDTDLDGWLDGAESLVTNSNLNDAIIRPSDIYPWGDYDQDGLANALEVEMGTDPLAGADPGVRTFNPIIKLTADPVKFTDLGPFSVWQNEGSLNGVFISGVGGMPTIGSRAGKTTIEFAAGTPNWMTGPEVCSWMNASGSRTVAAWVFNPSVSTTEDDVLFSWGGGSLGSPTPTLFSCRYGANAVKGAFAQSGTGSQGRGWGTVPPVAGAWSFVVYRYDSRTGSLLVMRNFEAAVSERNLFLQTGIFDSQSKKYQFVLAGENNGAGLLATGLSTGLAIGELQVFDQAVPLSKIIDQIYEPSRASYGFTSPLADTDGDGIPDTLEPGMGLNPAVADSDGDGQNDGTEFEQAENPDDFYNGEPHYTSISSGNHQIIMEGGETSAPIKFKITDIAGHAIVGAPADIGAPGMTPTVAPLADGNKVRLDAPGSVLSPTLSTRTDANGEISIFFKGN